MRRAAYEHLVHGSTAEQTAAPRLPIRLAAPGSQHAQHPHGSGVHFLLRNRGRSHRALYDAALGLKHQWTRYARALDEDPIQTKSLTSLVGLTLADLLAQWLEQAPWDPARTARLASFGLLWHGVSGHFWYTLLDRHICPEHPTGAAAVALKTAADQLIWAPLNLVLFFTYLSTLQGDTASLPDILATKFVQTLLAGYLLWPAAHLVNFTLVPSQHRLLYINVVNLFWTVYLSQAANAGLPAPQGPGALEMTPIPVSDPNPLGHGRITELEI